MKLLNYISSRFLLILFVLLSLWALVFYFAIKDEIYDSIDEGLENQMELVVQRIRSGDTDLLPGGLLDGYTNIREIPRQQAKEFKEIFKDTVLYLHKEEDLEPVRLMEDVFQYNGNHYQIAVSTSMVEEDDLVQSLLVSLMWLYFGLIVSLLILNNLLLKKVWHPFYTLLDRLRDFSIEKDESIEFEGSRIQEFSLLNQRVEQLIKKAVESYKGQKQFIENASHELQTPLAISINKLELLVENYDLDKEQLEIIAAVLNNLERLTRLNKSLLLLSKIENKQFPVAEKVNFNALSKQVIADFEDFALHTANEFTLSEKGTIRYEMNPDLAVILISNLLKNALIHGPDGTPIIIEIHPKRIEISNNGAHALNKKHLFSRFKHAGNEGKSTGLGLAISKAIADQFGLRLEYVYKQGHQFVIHFP